MKILQIETTSYCNARCIFCVHDRIQSKGTMKYSLFKKILNDAKNIDDLEMIVPMLNGEPFIDPKFINKLELINRILPTKKIGVFTNCSLITPKTIRKLSRINNLNMYFSLNGNNRDTRKRLMGINDFEHAVKMIKIYADTDKPYRVLCIRHPTIKESELNEFKTKWGKNGMIVAYQNFAGIKYDSSPKISCNRAINHMTVLWNGTVNLCCMDALGRVTFGDLNKQSIREVWESPERQAYVQAHLKGEIMKDTICEKCSGG